MLCVMDAFAQAVEDARQALSRSEGRDVSIREVARRAGISSSTLSYNLKGERRPKPALIQALSRALQVPEDELMRAAQVSAGYTVRGDRPDLGWEVARFLDDDDVDEEAKLELTARLAEIVASEMRKVRRERGQ